jgi:hypothetical protein
MRADPQHENYAASLPVTEGLRRHHDQNGLGPVGLGARGCVLDSRPNSCNHEGCRPELIA